MAGITTDTELLTPHIPRLLLQWISETPNETFRELEGSIAFVDISGFTKLSERLARRGKVGAEELTDAIGTCFTRLLAVAYGNAGSLIKFGGDALLLFFSGDDHQAKACRAAVGMRRELRDIGRMDCNGVAVALRMSVGVHSGRFHFFLVGDSHRELIVTGPAASETVIMESTAEAGEIVVSHATASALPSSVLGAAKGAGMLLRREPVGAMPERSSPPVRIGDPDLLQCIPVAVRVQLLGGFDQPEHRRVTVAFVHFDGTDALISSEGSEAAAEHLDVLVQDVQRAVDKNSVSFLGTDIDRDGGKIILAAGAPAATGDDEERMLLALREIIEGERRLSIRAGVNRGHVFAGDIGPFYRRTYTVMGDAVNLAARLMAKAEPGEILSTEGVLEQSRTQFQTRALEAFTVKGKSKPVRASSVGEVLRARRESADARTPMIGRDSELALLLDSLAAARQGAGRLVEIVGDPGIGKSRLLGEMRKQAGDTAVFSVSCELYGASTPYGAFRDLLRRLLGISEDADSETAVERVQEVLAAVAPELLPWAPLVATVVDVEMADTQETSALEDRFRRPKLNEVVVDLMARLLRPCAMLVFDDAHWMDETSSDLLRRIENHVDNLAWLVCVARRNTSEGFSAAAGPRTTRLDLQPLDAKNAIEMLALATEESPFRPDEMTTLAERSGGNPLFLEELVAAAMNAGGLETLPESVESLIMARIDRLKPADRNLLRRASVLGRTFRSELLVAILDGDTPDASTWRRIAEFLSPDDGGNLSFVNALVRDGAYEGLPYRLRRTLHAQVGDTIEKTAGDSPDDEAELLSMHFFHAQRYADAWRYSLVAGQRAKMIYANVEAASFYERALEAARHVQDLVPLEVARVREQLGDVRDRMGAYREAGTVYQGVRRLVAGDPIAEARIMLKISWSQAWLSRYSQALRWITRGLNILEGISGDAASKQRAELLVWYARFLQEKGNHTRAILWCQRAIEEAERSGNKRALADAYRFLDWAHFDLGQRDKATYSRKALALYEEVGDLAGQDAVLNNLGIFAFWQNKWSDAQDMWRQAQRIAEKIGNPVDAAYCLCNIAETLAEQGRLGEADSHLREAMRLWQAAGYRGGVAYAKIHLGRVAARGGRFEEARRLLEEGRTESRDVGAEVEVLEADVRLAECYLLEGDGASALDGAAAASARARTIDGVTVQTPTLERIRGYALMQLGRLEAAEGALNESLRAARARNAGYEVALTLRGFMDLARLRGSTVDEEMAREAGDILERVGVVSIPNIPLPTALSAVTAG